MSSLIRPTIAESTRPEPVEPAETEGEVVDQGDEGQGRGAAESKPRATRKRRSVLASEKTTPRKLVLPDGVYDRLQLLAIQRRSNASAVAAEILDRNLPRLRIERDA